MGKTAPSHNFQRRKKLQITLVITIVAALLLSSIAVWNYGRNNYLWGTSDHVRILLADPMASTTFPGLSLVNTDLPKHIGIMDKSKGASVIRWFRLNGVNNDQALKQAIQSAIASGWQESPFTGDEITWVGKRAEADTGVKLSIIITIEPLDGVYPNHAGEMRITLLY
ncbi:MAG: hypothetical protein ABIP74_01290 [Candidatus Saccharimonas sp.]